LRKKIPFSNFRKSLRQFVNLLKTQDQTFVLVTAVLIGVAGGYAAVGIQFAIKEFQLLFWQHEFSLEYIRSLPWWWKIAAPATGGLIVGLIIQFVAREAKGHGVPEVMEAILLRNGRIRPRVVIAKLFGSAIYIASGGSVGREGPVIQIGSAIGSSAGQLLGVNASRMRTFVACGAAAGIAAAFNAPVAGALFAIEILLGDIAVLQFSPIVVASVSATVVSRHYLGDFPAFSVPHYEMISAWELVFYTGLGVVSGLVASGFIKVLYASEDFFDRIKVPDSVKGISGGIAIGAIGIMLPEIFGVGYESIDAALHSNMLWKLALMLVVVKIIATSLSLGSGGSGGIFAPSLFLGATTGVFFGSIAHYFFPTITANPGAYALVGMGGVVAAATQGPITAILIIFEMTNDYKTILPLMLTCIVGTIVALKINKHSIYTLKLFRRGIDLQKGREVNVLKSVKVEDVYHKSIERVEETASFPAVVNRLYNSQHSCLHVVDGSGKLTGVISMNEIRQTLTDYDELKNLLIAADISNDTVVSINPEDTLDEVMQSFGRYHLDEMPVLNEQGDFLGTVQKTDVIQTYNRLISLKDITHEMSTGIKHAHKKEAVHVVDNYYVKEIEVPAHFHGKRIGELHIRNEYKIEILLIFPTRESSQPIHPSFNYQFASGNRMLVFGDGKDLLRLE
jgi:chloride channel protein, CIC family